MTVKFQVQQIDHVELTVPDRNLAAKWYCSVLGLEVLSDLEFWAEDPRGPLMIGTIDGSTKLALFVGNPTGSKRSVGFHRVAFCCSAEQFQNFLGQLPELRLRNEQGEIVNPNQVVDHRLAFSIYFCDPYGNQLEITTYEHESLRRAINN